MGWGETREATVRPPNEDEIVRRLWLSRLWLAYPEKFELDIHGMLEHIMVEPYGVLANQVRQLAKAGEHQFHFKQREPT